MADDVACKVLADNRDGDTFLCAQCGGGTFPKGWSDDEAIDEAADNGFDLTDLDDLVVVCDDCYQAMSSLIPPKLYTGVDVPRSN